MAGRPGNWASAGELSGNATAARRSAVRLRDRYPGPRLVAGGDDRQVSRVAAPGDEQAEVERGPGDPVLRVRWPECPQRPGRPGDLEPERGVRCLLAPREVAENPGANRERDQEP